MCRCLRCCRSTPIDHEAEIAAIGQTLEFPRLALKSGAVLKCNLVFILFILFGFDLHVGD